jgi:hypothetical protein
MGFMFSEVVALETATSSGNFSAVSANAYTGRMYALGYERGTTPISTDCGIIVTAERSSQIFLNTLTGTGDWFYFPRSPVHDSTAGTSTWAEMPAFPLVNERVMISITSSTDYVGESDDNLRIYVET